MAALAAKLVSAKVVLTVAPLFVKVPDPAALPKVWLALRTVKVPVVAPMLMAVPAWRVLIVVGVLNRLRVAALDVIVPPLRLMPPVVPATRVTALLTLLLLPIVTAPVEVPVLMFVALLALLLTLVSCCSDCQPVHCYEHPAKLGG